jgi:hypothetical protein
VGADGADEVERHAGGRRGAERAIPQADDQARGRSMTCF